MRIEFVSHAGFIIEANDRRIFIDPWTKSKAFNDSWALLSEPMEVDYSKIDYLFITHEHPDHFNFPTLKSIPETERKRIRVLYQEHASLRLKKAFEKLGFSEVIELPIYKWIMVDEIEMFCGSSGSMDSFLVVRHDGKTIFNLNDCVFREKQYRYIKRKIGEVDFLFTQFSFADWVGNKKDELGACEKKIYNIKLQKEIFQPSHIIPFASFIYFCNEENARMNKWINTPEDILAQKIPEIAFMYSGDTIDTHSVNFDSNGAVERYMNDLNKLKIDPTPEPVSFMKILEAIRENLKIFKSKIIFPFIGTVKPFAIYIHDLDKSISIDPRKGIVQETERANCRYIMCSQVCWYTFAFSWGTGTLQVSGMYLDEEFKLPMSNYFFFQNMISTDFLNFSSMEQSKRTAKFLWRKKGEIFYRFT